MKPLLIGQAPGPNTDPEMPLYPLPKSSAGGRLQALMNLQRGTYLRTFDRTNLLYTYQGDTPERDKFPLWKARLAAEALRPVIAGRTVILVGRSVARAFGFPLEDTPFHEWVHTWHTDYVVVPHPSGRNRWYNLPGNTACARAFWAEFIANLGEPSQV